MRKLLSLVNEERGIQHAEEALLLALVAVAAIAAVTTLGGNIGHTFTRASGQMCASDTC